LTTVSRRRTGSRPERAAEASKAAGVVAAGPGSIKAMARRGGCANFGSVHDGGRGGRPGASSCAAPECECEKFVETTDARVPLDNDNLTAAEVAQLTGLSVHTLS
jgi:hypothetical protein